MVTLSKTQETTPMVGSWLSARANVHFLLPSRQHKGLCSRWVPGGVYGIYRKRTWEMYVRFAADFKFRNVCNFAHRDAHINI
jgi:hypothetical protein